LWKTFFGGDRHDAIAEWRKVTRGTALRTHIRCSYAIFGLSLLRGDFTSAMEEIRAGIDVDPLNGFAHSMMAMVKTLAGDLDDVLHYAGVVWNTIRIPS